MVDISLNNNKESRLSLEVVGDNSLPPLLLIHGFLSSNFQWSLNETALAKHFQLFKVELWGHGNSPVPTDESAYSIDEYLYQLEMIRNHFAIEKWSLIGQSFGAGIVLNYAQRFPQHCIALVTTNSMSAFSQSYSLSHESYIEKLAMSNALLEKKGVRGLPMHPIHSKRIEPILKEKMVVAADSLSKSVVIGHFSMLTDLSVNAALMPKLCRSYLINGVFEKAFQAEVESISQRWPHLEIHNLQGGHSVNLDCPQEFNEKVINCLKN